jgi:cytochrome c-type biogenesis protein
VNPADVVLNGSLLLAMPLASLAGLASFLSPCVLPLVPGYLGYVSGSANTRSRMVLGSVLFVFGFTAVFVSFGAVFGGLGSLVYKSGQAIIQPLLGLLVIALGLVMLGRFEWLQRTIKLRYRPEYGLVGAPFLGIVFGLGWTPCIGPTFAAVLAMASQTGNPARGTALAICYALGLGAPFIALAFGFNRATNSVAWVKKHIRQINIAGASLLILLGVAMVTGLWNLIVTSLQEAIVGYLPAL